MAHTLLISNDDLINSLYPLNINLYVGFDVTLKKSWDEARKLLDARPFIDLIAVTEENAIKVVDYLKNENLDMLVLVLGESKTNFNNNKILVIKNKYNVQDILKIIAKLFNITAKTMAEKIVPNYYPIPFKFVLNLEKVPADMYVKNSTNPLDHNFTLIANKNGGVDPVIAHCKSHKIETLYILSIDRLKLVNELTSRLLVKLGASANLPVSERLDLNEQGFELVSEHIGDSQLINEEILSLHKTCIDSSKEIVKKMPNMKDLLDTLLNNKSSYVYTHSILISFVCNHIVKHVSWGGPSHADKLAYIAFYHDLFLVPLFKKYPDFKDEEELLFNPNVTAEEKEIILNHAKTIGEMVAKFPKTPIGSDAILRQHHGIVSGVGFAVDFKDDIAPLAKVFIVAESYVKEILKDQNYPAGDNKMDLSKFNKMVAIDKIVRKYTKFSYTKITETLDKVPI